MIKEVFYRQCELIRAGHVQVAWIPERYAVVGKYLKIKDEDGWRVTWTSTARISEWERRKAGERPNLPSIDI